MRALPCVGQAIPLLSASTTWLQGLSRRSQQSQHCHDEASQPALSYYSVLMQVVGLGTGSQKQSEEQTADSSMLITGAAVHPGEQLSSDTRKVNEIAGLEKCFL